MSSPSVAENHKRRDAVSEAIGIALNRAVKHQAPELRSFAVLAVSQVEELLELDAPAETMLAIAHRAAQRAFDALVGIDDVEGAELVQKIRDALAHAAAAHACASVVESSSRDWFDMLLEGSCNAVDGQFSMLTMALGRRFAGRR